MTTAIATLKALLPDEAATRAFGTALAHGIEPGMVIYLRGDLGTGKTTLVRGVLAGLGHTGSVKSPTYTLVEPYALSRLDCYHFDLYRLQDPQDWQDSGFRDYADDRSICLIEWPERGAGQLPAPDLVVGLQAFNEGREVTLEAATGLGERCIRQLEQHFPPSAQRAP